MTTAVLESAEGETKVCGQTGYRTQDLWLTSQVPYRLRHAARLKDIGIVKQKRYTYQYTCATGQDFHWNLAAVISWNLNVIKVPKSLHPWHTSTGKPRMTPVSVTRGLPIGERYGIIRRWPIGDFPEDVRHQVGHVDRSIELPKSTKIPKSTSKYRKA